MTSKLFIPNEEINIQLPPDADSLEIELYDLLVKGIYEPRTSAYVYAKIKDPIDKFITCYVFDLGHTQKETQIAVGLSKVAIWRRIKKIKQQVLEHARGARLVNL